MEEDQYDGEMGGSEHTGSWSNTIILDVLTKNAYDDFIHGQITFPKREKGIARYLGAKGARTYQMTLLVLGDSLSPVQAKAPVGDDRFLAAISVHRHPTQQSSLLKVAHSNTPVVQACGFSTSDVLPLLLVGILTDR